jgi:hypothetical protein
VKQLKAWIVGNSPVFVSIVLMLITGLIYSLGFKPDLLGNLFAEAIGIFVTVTLVDQLLRVADRKRTRAPRFAAYQEANNLLRTIGNMWANMVQVSLDAAPQPEADLFSLEYINVVRNHLDLDSANTGSYPPYTWRKLLMDFSNDVEKRVDQIIQRYNTSIDPDLVAVLTRIENLVTFKLIFRHLDYVQWKAETNKERSNALVFPANIEEELKAVRELHKLLTRQSLEFCDVKGYRPPYDLLFRTAVHEMRTRSDKIGANRR